MRMKLSHWTTGVLAIIGLCWPAVVSAQDGDGDGGVPGQPSVFGIYVDPSGCLRHRQADSARELAVIRARARSANSAKGEDLHFVSLPKVFAEVRALMQAGKPIPAELRYLGGLTQIRYVVADPEAKDLLIGGPAEAIDVAGGMQPKGKASGRPVLQLDDLVVAMRMANGAGAMQAFGCSIDPPDHSVDIGRRVAAEYANRPRRELAAALAGALGPQKVRFFGAPADTRLAFVCVAADYQLKRYSIALDAVPVPGVGHSIDNSRAAGNGFWFETLYEPLLVSADGLAFGIRGQRLQLKAGAVPFDEAGATPKAKAWAARLTEKIPQLAAAVPLYADLQNIADLALVARLIRTEKLDQRIGWDGSWALDSSAYPVAAVAVPRTADTLVHFTSGSVAAGGVGLGVEQWVRQREVDRSGVLAPVRKKAR